MIININNRVSFTLTKRGADILNEYEALKLRTVLHTEGELYKEQLWHIMEIFGGDVSLGMESPFENCEITVGES